MTPDEEQLRESRKATEEKLLTIGDLLKFLQRRRTTIFAAVGFFLLLAIAYCAVATRRYKAETTIEIKRPEDSLGLNKLIQGSSQGEGEQNPLEENVTLATKKAELESESLALRVVENLNMENTHDFQPHFGLNNLNPLTYIGKLFSAPVAPDAAGTPLDESPTRRAAVFKAFESHLKVEVVPGTRLLSIDYSSPDPKLAAEVSNTLVADLAEYSFKTRYTAVQQLSSWLHDQLATVEGQAEDMQAQEAKLRRDTETYTMGGTNAAGQTLVYSPLLDSLQQSTQALSQAESNQILRGAIQQIVKSKDPTLISGLAGSGLASSGNPQSATSLDLIRDLQTKETAQQMLVSQDEKRYGKANPKLIQDKAQLDAIKSAVEDETARMRERANHDYEVAAEQVQAARTSRDKLMKRADDVNDKVLQYEIIHQEAIDARQLYTDLNNRVREAGVLAGLQSNDMTVVSTAFAPDKPDSPKILLILGLAIVAGTLIGVVIAGIKDVRDDKVNNVETVETELGIPVYAVTPDFNAQDGGSVYARYLYRPYGKRRRNAEEAKSKSPIHVVAESDSQYAESVRTLRTAILLSRPGQAAKVILITSSTPAEGKSTTSSNLAATFARTGTRTLLVEVDLRKPVLARRLGLQTSPDGLSRILTGQLSRDFVEEVPGVPNLYCLPAGQRPPDPHELISSPLMNELIEKWKAEYDLVILDGPPVLPVVDSVLLSQKSDLVLVITRFGRTSINSLRTAHRLLSRQVRSNIGAVLNAVSQGSEGYYDYYGYRYTDYKYEDTEDV